MLAVQNILKDGCRRGIGNGVDTIIGKDAWLPDDEYPFVQTVWHDTIFNAQVVSLLNEQGTWWDVQCVNDIFDERDAKLILQIPISVRKPPDSWIWHWDHKGQ